MSSNARYISFPIKVDPQDLMQSAFDYLKAKYPGWSPSEGQLDTWLTEAFALEAADVATLASQFPRDAFRYYGATLFGIAPIDNTAATVATTWLLADINGHTIAASTQVGIRNSDGDLVPFRVLSDVIVPGGTNTTTAGQVILVANRVGASSSGLGVPAGLLELIDPISWVTSITQVAATSGGVDAESDDNYLSRLAVKLQAMSPRPILPNDFSILARDVAGVQRAVTIDGYNPSDGTFGNERMVTVVAVDADGAAVSAPVKAAMAAYLDSLREINFVVNTLDPTFNVIDVSVTVTTHGGYTPAEVQALATAAIQTYLDPALWGLSPFGGDNPSNPLTWVNDTAIRYLELATVINNTAGVNIITSLTLGLHGGALSAANYNMTGVVPLPQPGTITVVAS